MATLLKGTIGENTISLLKGNGMSLSFSITPEEFEALQNALKLSSADYMRIFSEHDFDAKDLKYAMQIIAARRALGMAITPQDVIFKFEIPPPAYPLNDVVQETNTRD